MKIVKSFTLVLISCCLFLGSGFTTASADEETDAIADQYNKNKSNSKYKVVCRKEAPIGSRIKRKVCRTVASMGRSRTEARRQMDRLRSSVTSNPGG